MILKKEELIKILIRISKDINRPPRTTDLQNRKLGVHYEDYVKVFGSWKKALTTSGFNVSSRTFKYNK